MQSIDSYEWIGPNKKNYRINSRWTIGQHIANNPFGWIDKKYSELQGSCKRVRVRYVNKDAAAFLSFNNQYL